MKFADLFGAARDLGADLLATGHYVVARDDGRGGQALYRAADPDRDQSYFLFATTREQLKRLRFPLGAMPKPEVRELARRFGLINADKPDSQDICFVPAGHYSDMIERLMPGASAPGDIVHIDGRVLGRHAGIVHYTIGQRRGLGIAATEPLYVVALDAPRSRVVVGPRSALAKTRLKLRDVNWIGDGELAGRAGRRTPRSARACARPGRPPRRSSCRRARSISSSPKAASPPGRPASSTSSSTRARACWAAASSPHPEICRGEQWPRSTRNSVLGIKRKAPLVHEIGQNIDDLSAPELAERIGLLKAEIERLERAIEARQATRSAAHAAFKL